MRIEDLLIIDMQNQRYRLVKENELFALKEALSGYESRRTEWDALNECNPTEFGQKFRILRESKQITVPQLAVKTGMQESNIRSIELGHRTPRPPTKSKLIRHLQEME